jgi:DNA-binding transcriptional LysR family regulator
MSPRLSSGTVWRHGEKPSPPPGKRDDSGANGTADDTVGCLLMARMPTTPPSAARDQPVAQLPISGSSLAIIPASTSAGLLSDAAFAGEGIPRRIACEVGDWELFLELVSAGVGIGLRRSACSIRC